MGKKLVIVESPTKAKTINKILGAKEYVVRASFGHIRDLPKSKIGIDIDNWFVPTYVTLSEKGKAAVVAELKSLAKDAPEVYLCSDPDREGEAIAWHLAEILGVPDKKLHRVTYNEITPKAIKEAFLHPRKVDMNLVNSQQARRFLDRIVGYKLSPLLWTKILRGLSAGRVQSVAVRLLSEREEEIRAFKADEYWTCFCNFCLASDADEKTRKARLPCHSGDAQVFKAELKELGGKKIVSSAEEVDKAKAKPKDYEVLLKAKAHGMVESLMYSYWVHKVSSAETKETKQHTVPPFSTSYLQMAAANRLGFDSKRTMGIAQKLYEGADLGQGNVGLITYMRTDSFSVSKDAQQEAKDFILHNYGAKYYPDKPNYFKGKKSAQEAHECVRPTNVSVTPAIAKSKLATDEHKLYELIWQRFVASQMGPAIYDSTSVEIESLCPKEYVSDGKTCKQSIDKDLSARFRASGRVMKFDGFQRVYGRDDESDTKLPPIKSNEEVLVQKVLVDQHFTQPPPRFTDASLVKIMEQEGIGRPSTYASIISVIQERGYVKKNGKGGRAPLAATDLGMIVTQSLVGHMPLIMDVGFTRDMEDKLDDVESGSVDYIKLLGDFWKDFEKQLKAATKSMPSTKEGWKTDQLCPKCSGAMTRRISKFGFFYACQNEKCKAMMNVGADGKPEEKRDSEPTGIKCDKCSGDVFFAKGRFGPYLHCGGYRDKENPCKFTMTINKAGECHRKMTPLPTEVDCPKCKKLKMVVKVSNRGKKNKPFLACPGYPKCRAADDLPEEMKALGEQAMTNFYELRGKDKHDQELFKDFMSKQEPESEE